MKTLSDMEMRGVWREKAGAIWPDARRDTTPTAPFRRFGFNELKLESVLSRARSWVAWLDEYGSDELLVWVQCWGIWTSSENHHLYYTWREAKHDHSSLAERPGHVLLEHERLDCISLVYMCLLFGWDFVMFAPGGQRAISFDHDWHGVIVARDKKAVDMAMASLELEPGIEPPSNAANSA
jgi:hypothetical protein